MFLLGDLVHFTPNIGFKGVPTNGKNDSLKGLDCPDRMPKAVQASLKLFFLRTHPLQDTIVEFQQKAILCFLCGKKEYIFREWIEQPLRRLGFYQGFYELNCGNRLGKIRSDRRKQMAFSQGIIKGFRGKGLHL